MFTKTVLDNGIRVITEHMPHVHSVSLGIWVNSGSRHEPETVSGVTHFLEHLLFKGTPQRSALDIAREIDAVGGVLNAFTGREYVCYYAKVLHEQLPRATALLSDIFLNSAFDAEEIEKERQVVLQEISRLEDSPDEYIHDQFYGTLWAGNPLGRPILGSLETIANLDREQIVAHRQRTFQGRDIIITAAGRVRHEELLALLAGDFAALPAGTPALPPSPHRYRKQVRLTEKELEQAHFCLGTRALSQDHPARYTGYLLNSILGGSMSSRLFQEIRERRALAYSIYSYLTSHLDTGALVIYAGVSHDRLEEALQLILQEMRRIKQEPVGKDELAAAAAQVKGQLFMSLESTDNRMTRLAKNEIYFGRQLPLEEVLAGFDQVRPANVTALAAELFDDSSLTLEVMGRSDDLEFPPLDFSL